MFSSCWLTGKPLFYNPLITRRVLLQQEELHSAGSLPVLVLEMVFQLLCLLLYFLGPSIVSPGSQGLQLAFPVSKGSGFPHLNSVFQNKFEPSREMSLQALHGRVSENQ